MLFMVIKDTDDRLKVEKLYDSYRKLLFFIANGILRDKHLAEDAVHDAFIKIIKNLHKVGEISCPRTRNFIVIICRNVAKDIYKKRIGVIDTEDEQALSVKEMEIMSNPLDIVISQESVNRLTAAIEQLSETYRDTFLLKRVYGFSREEIAETFGISVEAVKKRLVRAKAKIIEQLGEEGDQDEQEK